MRRDLDALDTPDLREEYRYRIRRSPDGLTRDQMIQQIGFEKQ